MYISTIVDSLNKNKVSKVKYIMDHLVTGSYLAGGSLRTFVDTSETVSDYDLFFKSQAARDRQLEVLKGLGFIVVFQCPRGELTTLTLAKTIKVQLITKRFYTDHKDLLGSFDFNVCKACITEGVLYFSREFIKGVVKKVLLIDRVEYPVATINRIGKYQAKGYRLTQDNLVNFINLLKANEFNEESLALYID